MVCCRKRNLPGGCRFIRLSCRQLTKVIGKRKLPTTVRFSDEFWSPFSNRPVVDNFQEVAAVSRQLGSVLTHRFCGRGIKNKVVVITGASSGLGEASARLLSAQGATLVLGARRIERLEKLAHELNGAGGKAIAVETDVTQCDQVKNLVEAAVEKYGRIDVMLNNAGLMQQSPLEFLKVGVPDAVQPLCDPHYPVQRGGILGTESFNVPGAE